MTDDTAATQLLRQAGEALYGQTWQSELAADLGVTSRTVRYWLAGKRLLPAGAWADIAALLRRRGHNAITLAATIDATQPTTTHPTKESHHE